MSLYEQEYTYSSSAIRQPEPVFRPPTNHWRKIYVIPSPKKYQKDDLEAVIERSLKSLFDSYSFAWLEDTKYLSSPGSMRRDPYFQRLVDLGQGIAKFALQELANGNSRVQWMVLLRTLLNFDPVPEHSRGITSEMAEEWLAWGRRNHLIDA